MDYDLLYQNDKTSIIHKTLPIQIKTEYREKEQYLSLEEVNISGEKRISIFALNEQNLFGIITQIQNAIIYESKLEIWQYINKTWQLRTKEVFSDFPLNRNIILDNCTFSVQNMNTNLLPMFYYFNPKTKELLYTIDWETINNLCMPNKEEQFFPSEYIPGICLLKNCLQNKEQAYRFVQEANIFEPISK